MNEHTSFLHDESSSQPPRYGTTMSSTRLLDDDSVAKASYARVSAVYFMSAITTSGNIDFQIDDSALYFRGLFLSTALKRACYLALFVLVLLPVFEDPRPVVRVSFGVRLVVELVALWVLLTRALFKLRFYGTDRIVYRDTSLVLHIAVALLLLAEKGMLVVSPHLALIRFVRPLLLFEYSTPMQRWVVNLARTVLESYATLLFLTFHIVLFAILGTMLFFNTDEGKAHFSSFPDSVISLVVLLSTCNSPSIYMPAYTEEPLSILYFVAFVVLGIFLILNVVLATIYHGQKGNLKREAQEKLVLHQAALLASYRMLLLGFWNEHHGITLSVSRFQSGQVHHEDPDIGDEFHRFVGRSPPLPLDWFETFLDCLGDELGLSVSSHLAQFDAVQVDIQNGMTSYEGVSFADFVKYCFSCRHARQNQSVFQGLPGVQHLQSFEMAVGEAAAPARALCKRIIDAKVRVSGFSHRTRVVDLIVNLLLAASLGWTIWSLTFNMSDYIMREPATLLYFNIVTTCIFVVEMLIRIVASGRAAFFNNKWNVFEFTVVALAAVGSFPVMHHGNVGEDFASRESGHGLLPLGQALRFCRQARSLRFLHSIPGFRVMAETLGSLVPTFRVFGGILVVLFSSYAVLGMFLFSEVEPPEYTANDFSSYLNALVTLFGLMIVNDWNKTMASYVVATGSKWSQLYFVTWYFVAVIILLNSITSFVLEAFDLALAKRDERIEEDNSTAGTIGRCIQQNEGTVDHNVAAMPITEVLRDMFLDDLHVPSERETNQVLSSTKLAFLTS